MSSWNMSSTSAHRHHMVEDTEGANRIAQLTWNKLTLGQTSKKELSEVDIVPTIQRIYKQTGIQFDIKNQDIKSYKNILDRDSDGVVTYQDIQALCQRYLNTDPKKPRILGEEDNQQQQQQPQFTSQLVNSQNMKVSYTSQPQQQQQIRYSNQPQTIYQTTSSGVQLAPQQLSSSQSSQKYYQN